MKKVTNTRKYSMKKRARQAQTNENLIVESVRDLWMEMPLPEITLEKVAEKAGVTVRTVLRKFGSKEGLLDASVKHAAGVKMDREEVEPGNVSAAIAVLLDEYESMGDAVIRTIRAEKDVPAAAEILKVGRAKHRAWCKKAFGPYLLNETGTRREEKLLALVAATEVYLWKLLRRDLKKGRAATQRIFYQMVDGIISSNP